MNDQMTGLVGELVSDKISIKDALKNGLGMEQLPQEVPPGKDNLYSNDFLFIPVEYIFLFKSVFTFTTKA